MSDEKSVIEKMVREEYACRCAESLMVDVARKCAEIADAHKADNEQAYKDGRVTESGGDRVDGEINAADEIANRIRSHFGLGDA